LCGKDSLRDVHEKFPVRTEKDMQKVYQTMMEAKNKKDLIALSKQWSLHPIPVRIYFTLILFLFGLLIAFNCFVWLLLVYYFQTMFSYVLKIRDCIVS